jgi:hypothetical protein
MREYPRGQNKKALGQKAQGSEMTGTGLPLAFF